MKQLVTACVALAAIALDSAAQTTFSNLAPIIIPAGAPTTTTGPAAPYPATISISGTAGTITNLSVSLLGFSHTFPDDVDVLLVGPSGASVVLMSDTGNGFPVSGVNLSFLDGAPALPQAGALTSGTFSPTAFEPGDVFPAPAPAGPYGSSLATFTGTGANGLWSLYVNDDSPGDFGQIAGGFSITVTTSGTTPPGAVPDTGSSLLLLAASVVWLAALRRKRG